MYSEKFQELIHELADLAESLLDLPYTHFFETESGDDVCITITRQNLEIKRVER